MGFSKAVLKIINKIVDLKVNFKTLSNVKITGALDDTLATVDDAAQANTVVKNLSSGTQYVDEVLSVTAVKNKVVGEALLKEITTQSSPGDFVKAMGDWAKGTRRFPDLPATKRGPMIRLMDSITGLGPHKLEVKNFGDTLDVNTKKFLGDDIEVNYSSQRKIDESLKRIDTDIRAKGKELQSTDADIDNAIADVMKAVNLDKANVMRSMPARLEAVSPDFAPSAAQQLLILRKSTEFTVPIDGGRMGTYFMDFKNAGPGGAQILGGPVIGQNSVDTLLNGNYATPTDMKNMFGGGNKATMKSEVKKITGVDAKINTDSSGVMRAIEPDVAIGYYKKFDELSEADIGELAKYTDDAGNVAEAISTKNLLSGTGFARKAIDEIKIDLDLKFNRADPASRLGTIGRTSDDIAAAAPNPQKTFEAKIKKSTDPAVDAALIERPGGIKTIDDVDYYSRATVDRMFKEGGFTPEAQAKGMEFLNNQQRALQNGKPNKVSRFWGKPSEGGLVRDVPSFLLRKAMQAFAVLLVLTILEEYRSSMSGCFLVNEATGQVLKVAPLTCGANGGLGLGNSNSYFARPWSGDEIKKLTGGSIEGFLAEDDIPTASPLNLCRLNSTGFNTSENDVWPSCGGGGGQYSDKSSGGNCSNCKMGASTAAAIRQDILDLLPESCGNISLAVSAEACAKKIENIKNLKGEYSHGYDIGAWLEENNDLSWAEEGALQSQNASLRCMKYENEGGYSGANSSSPGAQGPIWGSIDWVSNAAGIKTPANCGNMCSDEFADLPDGYHLVCQDASFTDLLASALDDPFSIFGDTIGSFIKIIMYLGIGIGILMLVSMAWGILRSIISGGMGGGY